MLLFKDKFKKRKTKTKSKLFFQNLHEI